MRTHTDTFKQQPQEKHFTCNTVIFENVKSSVIHLEIHKLPIHPSSRFNLSLIPVRHIFKETVEEQECVR